MSFYEGSDVEEAGHAVSQREIVALYERFCQLDRTGKGFISADEFMGVPEFAVNPLCQVFRSFLKWLCKQLRQGKLKSVDEE